MEYDFGGYATRHNIKCSDGRTIKPNAFKDCDGSTVPLVWNHSHSEATNVLGHALLEYRDDGVYTYGKFNDTEMGNHAKKLVQNGDITALSIYANKLKQNKGDVLHGTIREVSLVLAGANPGAWIDSVIMHGEEVDTDAIIYTDDSIDIYHSEEEPEITEEDETVRDERYLEHAEEENTGEGKTIKEVFDTLNEEQKNAVYALIGLIQEGGAGEQGEEPMKHNVFEDDEMEYGSALSHADEMDIISLAKKSYIGTLQDAIQEYVGENESLAHGFEEVDQLFPEWHDTNKMPQEIKKELGWVPIVMNGASKSPFSRLRTKQFDLTDESMRAFGYKKGDKKVKTGVIKLLKRTTDPQTVYVTDEMHRDDIVDITDFDVVNYQWGVMKENLETELARAILIGDGRVESDDHKIKEDHIRSIWHDDELYTIHYDVDIAGMRTTLQGTDTSKHFGDEYVYAEAFIKAALFSRKNYKGSGNLTFFCDPDLINTMLLARDLNGRRIYNNLSDLQAALNVSKIVTVEEFANKTREDADHNTKKLLGMFVNMNDYMIGSTKGGEITKFDQFNIDFNTYKYLIETRLCGALVKVKSAIVLEEKVTA